MKPDKWMNVAEAASHIGVSLSTVYAMAQERRIPGAKVGKKWLFSRDDLDVWLRAQKPLEEFFTSADFDIAGNVLLRDPQKEAHSAAADFFEGGGLNAILQLPVGCGKTGVISILPFGIARGRVLVISPNITIREELSRALDITNGRACFWRKCQVLAPATLGAGPYVAVLDGADASIHDCDGSHFVLTNIQQLASSADRWLPQFSDDYFDMILVDEGHHNAAPSWKAVFKRFPNAKVVSLTATPFRSDNLEVKGENVYRYPFKCAMLKGYIKKLQAIYVAPEEITFTYEGDERIHSLAEVLQLKEEAWFSRGVAMSRVCNENIVDAALDRLESLRKSGTNHQIIAVACSVRHAKEIRSLFNERGFEAAEIHSKMSPEEREAVLLRLRAGALDCIVQVQMLGEGFDHPKLSVAAIFRPFRSLSPYVQFVGRIMRVVVQNSPRHPDNLGYVVTHIGLNLDQQLNEFRDMEKDDGKYFAELLSGEVPEDPPGEVLEGNSRMKLSEDMVVNSEIVAELFEEEFVSQDDEALLDELVAHAESLGFDESAILALRAKAVKGIRRTPSAGEFPVIPQRQRKEARKRLNEEVKHTAKLLLNRLDLQVGGMDFAPKFSLGLSGNNFVASVQMVNGEIDKRLQIPRGRRGTLKTEEFIQARGLLSEILDYLTRVLKAKAGQKNESKG